MKLSREKIVERVKTCAWCTGVGTWVPNNTIVYSDGLTGRGFVIRENWSVSYEPGLPGTLSCYPESGVRDYHRLHSAGIGKREYVAKRDAVLALSKGMLEHDIHIAFAAGARQFAKEIDAALELELALFNEHVKNATQRMKAIELKFSGVEQ